MASASSYSTLVQELYIAYFGRPADYYGLQNFEAALAAANAPTDAAALAAAYSANAAVKTLVDSFGASAESAALYGSGSTESFVNAIFDNLFDRPAAVSGLAFWSNAINSGEVGKGDAALAILAGAVPTSNSSQQATDDWNLMQAKVAVATGFTTALGASSTQIVDYNGAAAAQDARLMLASVTTGVHIITADSASSVHVTAGNGTNEIFTNLTGATIAITVGTGTNSIVVGDDTTGTISLGAHTTNVDAIRIGVSGTSLTAIEKISGLNNDGLDTLTFTGDNSALTFTEVTAASVVGSSGNTTQLASWIAAATGASGSAITGTAHTVTWFQFQGNTYLVETVGADTGALATGDTVVELTGTAYTFAHTTAAGGIVHLLG